MSQEKFLRERHDTRRSWMDARDLIPGSIGASECAIPAGYSPWQSVDELYEIKIGRRERVDISAKPSVHFGQMAEAPIRMLGELDLQETYSIEYYPYDILRLKDSPYIFATLDGELVRKVDGERGVLEIKTGELSKQVLNEWQDGRIPNHYFAQVCQQLLVTGYSYAIIVFRLSHHYNGSPLPTIVTGYRYIDARKPNVIASMEYIHDCDDDFHACCINQVRPTTTIRWNGGLLNTLKDPQWDEGDFWV